jgi:hypothetical protein
LSIIECRSYQKRTPHVHEHVWWVLNIFFPGPEILEVEIYAFTPAESPKDPLLTEFYDQQHRAAERMWGNQGSLMMGLVESLKHARTYSGIIAVAGGLSAFACFYFARNAYDGGHDDHTQAPRQSSAETPITTANAAPSQRPTK